MPSDPPHGTSTQPPDAHFASSVKSWQEKQKQICFADFSNMNSCLTDTLLLILVACAKRVGDTNCDLWPAERRYCAVGNPAWMPG